MTESNPNTSLPETNFMRLPRISLALLTSAAMLLAGCAGFSPSATSPAATATVHFSGSVHGGQQPITGASIFFYAAGSGYASSNANLLSQPVLTDAKGNFDIGSTYACTAGQQMYLVASGGDPGSGVNQQSVLMAALGDCANLASIPFININEVTTIGSVFALAPFMSGYSSLGAPPTNAAGLAQAFTSVGKLVDITTGKAGGPALAPAAIAPTDTIYALANTLATCINSTGGVSGDGSPCGQLFSLVTPSGKTAPTDTVAAALLIARNPAANAAALYTLAPPASPFATGLNKAPADWTLAINYPAGFSVPKSVTIDAAGNVWIANSGSNTVSVLAATGSPLAASPLSGNGLQAPAAIAIDKNGNAFVANPSANNISAFTNSGSVYNNSPFTASGSLSGPSSLAFDGGGNLWVGNSTSNSLTELNSGGAFVQQVTSGVNAPNAVAIGSK